MRRLRRDSVVARLRRARAETPRSRQSGYPSQADRAAAQPGAVPAHRRDPRSPQRRPPARALGVPLLKAEIGTVQQRLKPRIGSARRARPVSEPELVMETQRVRCSWREETVGVVIECRHRCLHSARTLASEDGCAHCRFLSVTVRSRPLAPVTLTVSVLCCLRSCLAVPDSLILIVWDSPAAI